MSRFPTRDIPADEMALWADALDDVKPLPGKAKPKRRPVERAAPAPPPAVPPPAPPQRPLELGRFSDDDRRRLGRQGQSLDARFDLHGLNHREGHEALKAFLLREQSRGSRTVLIITGKSESRTREVSFRRDVPLWLEHHEFSAVVAAIAPAHRRHGGEGALYVRLRRTLVKR